ncbi:MAG: hypothetical protein LBH34_02800, partial [Prevotellaceae bacterium]|nr:hypothetical protein [Prevotellaceae bacterium]
MAKGKALGKGIEVLLGKQELVSTGPVHQSVTVKSELIKEIPLDQIERNPSQPRTNFDEETLKELA